MVVPLTVSFIRPLLDHVDMVYKETYNFFHENRNVTLQASTPQNVQTQTDIRRVKVMER